MSPEDKQKECEEMAKDIKEESGTGSKDTVVTPPDANNSKQYRNPLHGGKLRNLKCICGSGKKVKKCHGKDYAVDVRMLNQITRLIDAHNKVIEQQEQ